MQYLFSLSIYAVLAGLPRSTIAPLSNEFRTPQPVLWRVLVCVITWPRLWKTATGYRSNSESCWNYVYWCTKFTQDELRLICEAASLHQPTWPRSRPRLHSTAMHESEVWRTFMFVCRTKSLPSSLHELTDTGTFKRHLNTFFNK